MQFSFIKEQRRYKPLTLITACATLRSNCNQTFAITDYVCFTLLWRNLGPELF